MPNINILSPHVADLRAAGEVVERPASVVKELAENAIDAGARNVTVEIRSGGMASIRVTDDGCGMAPEDAGIAFLRHATSKLRDERGLEGISTLGFRGEALAAISAVSHIELCTREKGAAVGTRVLLSAGEIDEMGPAGCPEGTEMRVADLFYNTPARLKFMKSDRAEGAACVQAALRCALGHPEVSLRMLRDGEEVFFSPGDGQMKSAVYALLGRDIASGLLECAGENDGIQVRGYVSAPHAGRGNRALQFFFLNGRFFRSGTLQAALEQAYKNTLLSGRFPACVLYLTLGFHRADVNVHPTKMEVKFTEEKKVFDAVYCAVRAALEERTGRNTAEIRLSGTTKKAVEPRPDFYRTINAEEYRRMAERAAERPNSSGGWPRPGPSDSQGTRLNLSRPTASYTVSEQAPRPALFQNAPQVPPKPEPAPELEPVSAPPASLPAAPEPPESPTWRLIGEALNTYILVEMEDALLLIDKHACHERINFDRLKAGLGPEMTQTLLTPLSWSPGAEAAELVEQNRELLAEAGFEAERFGEDGVILRAVPAELQGGEIAAMEEILESLRNGRVEDRREEILHTVACKAAIKAGSRSTPAELEALAARVVSGEIRYCPHGRPVSVRLTKSELDRQFKRIV